MTFPSALRFSSLLRCRLSSPSFALRRVGALPDRRFLSAAAPPSRRTLRPSRRKQSPPPIAAAVTDTSAGDGDGNGGVLVKDERIVPTELHKEATEAYMAYAMSVLLGRALPDVRDGLKPVHRRIL